MGTPENQNWQGNLSSHNPKSGYWVHTDDWTILQVVGHRWDTDIGNSGDGTLVEYNAYGENSNKYGIGAGPNLISFPGDLHEDGSFKWYKHVKDAFAGYEQYIDSVIGQGEAVVVEQTDNGWQWTGSLSNLSYKKGYWLMAKESFQLGYPYIPAPDSNQIYPTSTSTFVHMDLDIPSDPESLNPAQINEQLKSLSTVQGYGQKPPRRISRKIKTGKAYGSDRAGKDAYGRTKKLF